MENVLSRRDSAVGSTLRRWWNDPSIRMPTLIFLAARILTLLVALTAARVGPVSNPWVKDQIYIESLDARQPANILTPLVDPWHRWDTGWYLKIAQYGYSATDGTIIFEPLYPALMAAVGFVVGDKLLGGLIVSSIACLAFLIIFYKLARLEGLNDKQTLNTLVALVAFPTAFYMLAAYTEATFMATVAGCFLAARYHRWWLAAVLALAATMTRIQGVTLCLPIGWIAFIDAPRFWQDSAQPWAQRIREAIPRLVAVGIAPLAALAFYAYLALANLGSVTDAYEKVWDVDVRPPWVSVIDVIKRIVTGQANISEVAGFIALLIIVGLLVASIGKLSFPYYLFMIFSLVLVLMRYYSPTLLNGTMRYVLDFFPAFIGAGLFLTRHRRWLPVWVFVGAIIQLVILYLFACWQWIA